MQNITQLFLMAFGLAIMLLYPMGNLLIILPPNILLSPLNYLQTLGIDAHFILGFVISLIILKILSVDKRYPYGKGFVLLILSLISYVIFQIYKLEVSEYSFKHIHENSYNIKYLVEFIIFLFSFSGLILIYKSNLPKLLNSEDLDESNEYW